MHYEPTSKDIEFGIQTSKFVTNLLEVGYLVPAPVKLFPSGLASVADGLEYMAQGKVLSQEPDSTDH